MGVPIQVRVRRASSGRAAVRPRGRQSHPFRGTRPRPCCIRGGAHARRPPDGGIRRSTRPAVGVPARRHPPGHRAGTRRRHPRRERGIGHARGRPRPDERGELVPPEPGSGPRARRPPGDHRRDAGSRLAGPGPRRRRPGPRRRRTRDPRPPAARGVAVPRRGDLDPPEPGRERRVRRLRGRRGAGRRRLARARAGALLRRRPERRAGAADPAAPGTLVHPGRGRGRSCSWSP